MKKNRINITKLTFILIIFMSIIFFNYGNDFYWHVRIGEFIFKKRAIPYTDIFSWYGITNNLHWISHEWLFEVIIYLFQVLFGKSGAIVYTVIAIIILSHLIYKINESIFDKNKFYTIAWAIIGLISLSGYILPRPHLLSYIYFTIIIIFIIRLITNENSKLVFFTPIAIIMWANSHGGSSNLSYIIFALTIISSILPFKNKLILTKKQLYKLFYGFMCSIIFIIFNPHGIKMIIYPYQNITYTTMTNCIDEWQSINLTSINGICYSILIIGILLYILKNIKRVNLYDILLLFSFTILAIRSMKFIPFMYISSTITIPKLWKKNYSINNNIILVFIIICISFMSYFALKDVEFKKTDDRIIKYLKNNDTVLYNSYNLGGYLIYNDIKPFVDGRADMYVNNILCDVCNIEKGNNIKLIHKYNFDTYLVKNNSRLHSYLSKNKKFKLLINDSKNSLFIIKNKD